MKKILTAIVLFIVFSTIFFVRSYKLDISPMSAGFDEVSLGYNAYSILLTGKDEYGTRFPLSLRSYNDFKPALYSYLAIPFMKVWGLNDMTTRLPSTLMGSVSLIFLYLIIRKINFTRNAYLDLLIVFIISFLPWRLHFSRVAFESNVSMAFFSGMVWCLISFKQNLFYKIGALVFALGAIYSYHAARLAVPVLMFLMLLNPLDGQMFIKIKNPRKLLLSFWPIFTVIAFYIPLFLEANTSNILTRYSQTNIFNHFYPFSPGELKIFENIWINPLGNPLYYLSAQIAGHIFSYISPKNLALLIYPGVIKSAQAIGGSGMLGTFGGLMFVVGIGTKFKDFLWNKDLRFILYWILAGIAPAALTWEWFYPLRSINIYPALDIIVAFGIYYTFIFIRDNFSKLVKLPAYAFVIAVIIFSSVYNTVNEYGFGSWQTAGEFQPGGFKEGAPILFDLKDKYSVVYLDSNQAQSYELFWYYMKYPPDRIQAQSSRRNIPGQVGPPTFDFDNFIYKKFDWPKIKQLKSFVFWTSAEVKEEEILNEPGAKLIKIKSPNGYWIASIITKD